MSPETATAQAWELPTEPYGTGLADEWRNLVQARRARKRVAERSFEVERRPRFEVLRGVSDPIEVALKQAEYILSLEADFDDLGSPAYERGTLERAGAFLRTVARFATDECGAEIGVPNIDPGPDGTIDIHWESSGFELLVNIPDAPGERATFYGDDFGSFVVKGDIDPASPAAEALRLFSWLLTIRR